MKKEGGAAVSWQVLSSLYATLIPNPQQARALWEEAHRYPVA